MAPDPINNPATPEFLAELAERARRYAWSGDYVEVDRFVRDLYLEAGIEAPDLTAYEWRECDDGFERQYQPDGTVVQTKPIPPPLQKR